MDSFVNPIFNFYNGIGTTGQFVLWSIVKIVLVLGALHTLAGYAVLAERKISAWIQDRVGPNRVAPPFVKYIPILGPRFDTLGILPTDG